MAEEAKEETYDIESQIKEAMSSRVAYFKEQSDSLTFEGVRRLLEEYMGLEKFALDGQKRFIKQCLLECLDGADEGSKKSGEDNENKTQVIDNKESTKSHQVPSTKKDAKDSNTDDEEKMEDSPVMGLLSGRKAVKSEAKEAEDNKSQEVLSENAIRKAMRKRASYIKANLENITLAELRRLLENDLGVEKHSLDPYKKFISGELDKLLEAGEASESPKETKKKILKTTPQRKTSKKVSSDESSDSAHSESEEVEEDEEEPKKKRTSRGKMQSTEGPKKRKKSADENRASGRKRMKPSKTASEESDAEDSGLSEDGRSQSSNEKPVKKKEASTPAYGKRVEHLKSVIKSCGMGVPPSIYKKVKQAPEDKREACLIKELEGILSKEGLSANPSEKEIKEVKRRKERAKELEGIDMSNIVTSSRRRSTTSFVAPPKPKLPVEGNSDDAEDTDEGDGDEEEDDEEVEEEEEEDGGDDDEDKKSEEADEDKDDNE